jgi:hypothetical protein
VRCYARLLVLVVALVVVLPGRAAAHGVARGDARFLQSLQGAAIAPLIISARSTWSPADHLPSLIGVIFFYRPRTLLLCVSLFTIGQQRHAARRRARRHPRERLHRHAIIGLRSSTRHSRTWVDSGGCSDGSRTRAPRC